MKISFNLGLLLAMTETKHTATPWENAFCIDLQSVFRKRDSSFSDMTLHCLEDGRKLKCHRVILSACSDYFEHAFNWNPTATHIDIHDGITGSAMELVLELIYCTDPSTVLSTDNVFDVFVAVDYFQITGLMDMCRGFLAENTCIDTCVALLRNGWPLNTKVLMEYVAHNFDDILACDVSRNELIQLPLPIIMDLLKSDHLLIRDPRTKLITSAARREKMVLDFVLYYVGVRRDIDDISGLLSCVRWHILNVFCDEDDPRIAAFNDLYRVKHTKWFTGSSRVATEEDKRLYGARAYTCSELITTTPMLLNERHSSEKRREFDMVALQDEYISNMTFTRGWDDHMVGIQMTIASMDDGGGSRIKTIGDYIGPLGKNVILNPSEHIVRINAGTDYSKILNKLTILTSDEQFHCAFDRSYISNDDVMKEVNQRWEQLCTENKFDKNVPFKAVLVGVRGTCARSADHNYAHIITALSFVFRQVVPSSDMLVNKSLNYEKWSSPAGICDVEDFRDLEVAEYEQDSMLEEMQQYEDIPQHLL